MAPPIATGIVAMINVAVVFHSQGGHTRLQAEAIARGVDRSPGATAVLISAEQAVSRLEELDAADAIIFGCPTYMGNISAGMKVFLEAAVGRWFTQAWKDKVAGAFTNSTNFSGDKLNTLTGLMVNAMQQGMIYVGLGMLPASNEPDSMNNLEGPSSAALNRIDAALGPMATSFTVAAGTAPPSGDILTAEAYGERVATITAQLARGRN